MNIAVVGSRKFSNAAYLIWILDAAVKKYGNITVVSGGARGADILAQKYAEARGLATIIIAAKWDDLSHPNAVIKTRTDGRKYDALAGIRRNQDIVNQLSPERGDFVIALMNKSKPTPGTSDIIRRAIKRGIKVHMFWRE